MNLDTDSLARVLASGRALCVTKERGCYMAVCAMRNDDYDNQLERRREDLTDAIVAAVDAALSEDQPT